MKIQINYQQIADLAYRSAELANAITSLTSRLQAQHEVVRETWLGDGSVKYCAEMDERMLPAMRRLSDRLQYLNEGLKRVTTEFADAEERAAALFKAEGGGLNRTENGNGAGGTSSFNGASGANGTSSAGLGQATALQDYGFPLPATITSFDDVNDAYEVLDEKLGERVKFFYATENVTGITGVGFYQLWGGVGGFGAAPIEKAFLTEVTIKLYEEVNYPHANRLMNSPDVLLSPDGSGTVMANAFEHDLRMVEVEQGTVEKYLRQGVTDGKLGQTELDDISGWMDNNIGDEDNWAQEYMGRDLQFGNLSDRVALGKALMFILHGKSQAEYVDYMQQHHPVPPAAQ
jgi:WXG100 family type VII secretion target